jgi:hypothetical protein
MNNGLHWQVPSSSISDSHALQIGRGLASTIWSHSAEQQSRPSSGET